MQNFHFETLVRYCVALANEGGGQIILAVTDQLPRRVVGSQTFADLERTKAGLIERLRLRVEAEEVHHLKVAFLSFTFQRVLLGCRSNTKERIGSGWARSGNDDAESPQGDFR